MKLADVSYVVRVAGEASSWTMKETGPNSFEASITGRRGRNFVKAEVRYDLTSLSIRRLATSDTLRVDPEEGTAHKVYNAWIQGLESAIIKRVANATPYRFQAIEMPAKPFRESLVGHIFSKSYTIGEMIRVTTGEEMIRVKDYYVMYDEIRRAVTNRPFRLSGNVDGSDPVKHLEIESESGAEYPVVGSFVDAAGATQFVVHIPGKDDPGIYLAVDQLGSVALDHFIALASPDRPSTRMWFFRVSPPLKKADPWFAFHGHQLNVVNAKGGYTNYALIYNGTAGGQINVAYREFSPDNMARDAFYQNLIYRVDEKRIRFRGLLLSVERASNEEIIFTVESDAHEK